MIKIENRVFFILALLMALIVVLSNYLVQFPINYLGLENLLTYGALSYPVAFLITDLSNRKYGKNTAKKIVYLGFVLGVFITLYFSTNYSDLISIRIAIASGTAFIFAQLADVNIFDKLRYKIWFAAPLVSSFIGSIIDTFLFFSISFYGTEINWVTLSLGDLFVKILVALVMLIPFRLLLSHIQENSITEKKISV
ncbi:MAG: VUT family protein [Candidatus Pelagibacterales bacterium]|nr:MAG: VUT family protein [Pelagibacterales bacterium]